MGQETSDAGWELELRAVCRRTKLLPVETALRGSQRGRTVDGQYVYKQNTALSLS